MVVERLVTVLTAVVGPFLARFLLFSGRHRRRAEIHAYIDLAKGLEERDPEAATEIDEIVRGLTSQLVAAERRSLNRRFNPAAIFVAPLFLTPVLVPLVLIWPVDALWEWIFVAFAIPWTAIVSWATWDTSWKPPDEGAA